MTTKRRRLSVDQPPLPSAFRSQVPQPVPRAALRIQPTFIVTYTKYDGNFNATTQAMTLGQLRDILTPLANGEERDIYISFPIRIFVSGTHGGSVSEPLPDRPTLSVRTNYPQYVGGPRQLNLEVVLGTGEHTSTIQIPVTVGAILSVAEDLWRDYELDVKIRQRTAQKVYEAIEAPDVRRLIASYLPYLRQPFQQRRSSRAH